MLPLNLIHLLSHQVNSYAGSSIHVVVADLERIGGVLERRIRGGDRPRPAIDSSIPSYCEPIFVSCHLAFVVD